MAQDEERCKSAWEAFNAEVHIVQDYYQAPSGDHQGLSRTPAQLALQNKRSLAGFTRLSITFPSLLQRQLDKGNISDLSPVSLLDNLFPSLGWDSCCPFTWTDNITHVGKRLKCSLSCYFSSRRAGDGICLTASVFTCMKKNPMTGNNRITVYMFTCTSVIFERTYFTRLSRIVGSFLWAHDGKFKLPVWLETRVSQVFLFLPSFSFILMVELLTRAPDVLNVVSPLHKPHPVLLLLQSFTAVRLHMHRYKNTKEMGVSCQHAINKGKYCAITGFLLIE